MHWFQVFLILHVLAVIVAFGPDFSFPLIARMGQKNPRHGAFATEVIEQIERKVTIPLAVAIPLLGTGLIYTGHFDLWHSTWLVIAVILYPIVVGFALFVQLPNGAKLLRMMLDMEQAGPPPAAPGEPAPVAGGAAGPPPEFLAQVKKVQLGGAFLALAVAFFVVIMVWRPGSAFVH
jgi:hypothetical protein